MAFSFSPKITISGLVFCLDAANTKSFSVGSTTWNDLSISSKNSSLINSPTYNSSNMGYLNFTSSGTQYASAPSLGNLPTWTVETFVRFTSNYSSKVAMVVGGQYDLSSNLNFSIGTNNSPSNFNIAVGFFDGSWHNTNGVNYPLNTWVHITGTYDGTVIKQFTNGVEIQSLNYVGTPSSGGEIRINRRWDDVVTSGNFFDTNISVVRIYNRALSTLEILQNYNTIKGRFI